MSNNPFKIPITSGDAPDLLLKKITELGETLLAAKEAGKNNQKAIDFYSSLLNTMKYAWSHMMNMEYVSKRNTLLEAENQFLKEWAGSLAERLQRYEAIEQLKVSGEFEKVVGAVDEYMNTLKELTDHK